MVEPAYMAVKGCSPNHASYDFLSRHLPGLFLPLSLFCRLLNRLPTTSSHSPTPDPEKEMYNQQALGKLSWTELVSSSGIALGSARAAVLDEVALLAGLVGVSNLGAGDAPQSKRKSGWARRSPRIGEIMKRDKTL